MRILRKNKRRYFGSLNNKIVTNNRKCWKTIIPLFFAFRRESIALRKSNKTITDNEELAETFNAFLSNIVLTFNINLRPTLILLIQFSAQSKIMKTTQAFAKLR